MGDKHHYDQIDRWQDEFLEPPAQKQSEFDEEETLVCECFCVGLKELCQYTQNTMEDIDWQHLQEKFQVGLGCGSCHKNKNYWMKRINS